MKIIMIIASLIGSIITRCEGDNHPFPAGPNDRVDVVMIPDVNWVGRCADMGGEPVLLVSGHTVCEGVNH